MSSVADLWGQGALAGGDGFGPVLKGARRGGGVKTISATGCLDLCTRRQSSSLPVQDVLLHQTGFATQGYDAIEEPFLLHRTGVSNFSRLQPHLVAVLHSRAADAA